METYICSCCNRILRAEESIDLWALVTVYDARGEVLKTSEGVDIGFGDETDKIHDDYITVGTCCQAKAIPLWNAMVATLTGGT